MGLAVKHLDRTAVDAGVTALSPDSTWIFVAALELTGTNNLVIVSLMSLPLRPS